MKLPDPAILCIVQYPYPVLKEGSAEVKEFGPKLQVLADRMFELMRAAKGVGLAAPQVGLPIRFFVANPTGEPDDDSVYVNPRFTELTGAAEAEEGCLSLPGIAVTMRRATRAVMEGQDITGKPCEWIGEDLEARVWQHEVDHLEGRLIIDSMSTPDEIANRRAVKLLKAERTTPPRM
jgi:peptide deformylase